VLHSRAVSHAGQTTQNLTPLHGKTTLLKSLIANIHAALQHIWVGRDNHLVRSQRGNVDRPGVRVAVAARTAYTLYLARSFEHAELVEAEGLEGSFRCLGNQRLDALACLKPRLMLVDAPDGAILRVSPR
jgi:hypothetical protein